jgi:hypothetical protein
VTSLDDALNSSAPVYAPHTLYAYWQELANEVINTNPDTPINLSEQMDGSFKVEQSLDDALPDPVTMTQGNDASGSLIAALLGREEITADTMGWRTNVPGSSGAALSSAVVLTPSDCTFNDYAIAAVTVNSNTVVVSDYHVADENLNWQFLGAIDDGASLKTWVFGKRMHSGVSAFTAVFSAPVSAAWICAAWYARTPNGIQVPLRPGVIAATAESASVTGHVTGPVDLTRRGFLVSVWSSASASGPWAATGGSTELGESVGSSLDVMIATSSAVNPPSLGYTTTANSNSATATATEILIPLEIMDRPRMDGMRYFSPFNTDSPVYGFDRDTADTTLDFNVLTATGIVGTRIQTGQMADISVNGRKAELSAVSKTRIALGRSLVLPMITGNRENCSVDWLATWLMARGGMYPGPAPGPLTRYWAPLYGSTHAHMDTPYGYNAAVWYDATASFQGLRPPSVVEGPYVTGMFAQQTATRTEEIRLNAIRLDLAREVFPNVQEVYPGGLFYDQMSLASNSGRLTFWLRGDPATSAPAYLSPGDDLLFQYLLYQQNSVGGFQGYVIITVRSSDRNLTVQMGSDVGGAVSVVYTSVLTPLETDGNWHFYGIAWDYGAGTVRVKRDGLESSSSSYASGGANNTTTLPTTDASGIAAGNTMTNLVRSHLPISDVQIEAGAPAYSNSWTRHYPTPEAPALNTIMRPTFQSLEAIASTTPVDGWDTLAELARATLSAYRANETDGFEFLPLTYFGEAAQMTPSVTADTDVNAAELAVRLDPTKARNVVTLQFDETRVDTNFNPLYSLSSAVEIPRGVSTLVVSLDLPCAEIHGQSSPFGAIWTLTNLTSGQIAAPATIPTNVHYMSVNASQDGGGTILAASSVTAKIVNGDASTITLQFTNKTSKSAWLSNNGNEVPFLQLLGYSVRATDGYVTQRDAGSIGVRRERALTADVSWIQNRAVATNIAQLLVTMLARPRPEIAVTVMGDPRRTPGQLVQLLDAEGTQAAGTWRILSITHNGDGAQYTQDLALVQVLPIAVWDGPDGWDYSIWAE